MQPGILYGIGLGPGDSKWVTIEAASILNQVDRITFISGRAKESRAARIAAPFLKDTTEILTLPMPGQPDPEMWRRVVRQIQNEVLAPDKRCAVACLGDPLLYGSISHILTHLPDNVPVKVISGLWSGGVAAAGLSMPWTTYDDSLSILPATASDNKICQTLADGSPAVILKIIGHEHRIYSILKRYKRHHNAWLVSEIGTPNQSCELFREGLRAVSYFSLLMVAKSTVPLQENR